MAKLETIRVLLAISAFYGWEVHHLDVKSTFLNDEVMEEIYVKQLEGYEIPGKEHHVDKLKKALYGLKQAPRAWYSKLEKSLLELGLNISNHKPVVYYNLSNLFKLYVRVFVDDLLIAGSTKGRISKFKDKMKSFFDMTDLGLLKSFLGIQVKQFKGEMILVQSSVAPKILFDFNLLGCNSSQTLLELRQVFNHNDSKN